MLYPLISTQSPNTENLSHVHQNDTAEMQAPAFRQVEDYCSSDLSSFEFRVVDLAKGPVAMGSLARSTTFNPNSLS